MSYQRANNCSSATNLLLTWWHRCRGFRLNRIDRCLLHWSRPLYRQPLNRRRLCRRRIGVCIDALLSSSADIRGGTLLSGFGANANAYVKVISKPLRGSGQCPNAQSTTSNLVVAAVHLRRIPSLARQASVTATVQRLEHAPQDISKVAVRSLIGH